MLRLLKNRHNYPRLTPFQITTTSTPSATANIGYGDVTVTRGGTAGAGNLTGITPFRRNGLFFATQSVGNGGYATLNSATSAASVFPYSILDKSGAAVDGIMEGLLFGWDNSSTDIVRGHPISSVNAGRLIWGKVTGTTGVVTLNPKDFSCTRTAAGIYAITFPRAFGQTPVVIVTAARNTSNSTAKLSSKTATGVTVTMAPTTGTATDSDFYICAMGQDSRSDAGRLRAPLQNSQRKPKITVCEVTNTGGTWTFTTGGNTGGADFTTIVDNGAGDFTISIAEPFAREPAIFATTTTQRAQVLFTSTGSTVEVQTLNSAGSATDVNGVTHVMCIGSDVLDTF